MGLADVLVRPLRATGADLPFGAPAGAHPGVALESYCWRIVDAPRRRALLVAATRCRDAATKCAMTSGASS